jgi:hypothetical protein
MRGPHEDHRPGRRPHGHAVRDRRDRAAGSRRGDARAGSRGRTGRGGLGVRADQQPRPAAGGGRRPGAAGASGGARRRRALRRAGAVRAARRFDPARACLRRDRGVPRGRRDAVRPSLPRRRAHHQGRHAPGAHRRPGPAGPRDGVRRGSGVRLLHRVPAGLRGARLGPSRRPRAPRRRARGSSRARADRGPARRRGPTRCGDRRGHPADRPRGGRGGGARVADRGALGLPSRGPPRGGRERGPAAAAPGAADGRDPARLRIAHGRRDGAARAGHAALRRARARQHRGGPRGSGAGGTRGGVRGRPRVRALRGLRDVRGLRSVRDVHGGRGTRPPPALDRAAALREPRHARPRRTGDVGADHGSLRPAAARRHGDLQGRDHLGGGRPHRARRADGARARADPPRRLGLAPRGSGRPRACCTSWCPGTWAAGTRSSTCSRPSASRADPGSGRRAVIPRPAGRGVSPSRAARRARRCGRGGSPRGSR